MKKINLAITGCMGRMGQQLIKTSKANKNFKLVSLTENKIINKKIMGIRPNLNTENAFKKASVIIDFTVPKCTLKVLKIATKFKKTVVIGTTVEVPSIDGGKSKIKIPAGTQHGKQFRLKGKGMPVLRRSVFGDLYIRIVTQVPTSISKRQKEILEEFNEIESNKPDPVIKSFFEKAKKFWKRS